jgi:zinc transporter 7
MASQFLTAVGAFVGTFLGIWIAETSSAAAKIALGKQVGLFGTSVMPGDLVIPMTAGGELPRNTADIRLPLHRLGFSHP